MAANTMAIENSFRMNPMAGVALTAGPEAAMRQRYDQPLRMNWQPMNASSASTVYGSSVVTLPYVFNNNQSTAAMFLDHCNFNAFM